ncbi:unnamed protein product [Arctia plantaginis]|uniref:ODAD1 central coiled coil region domain-containing protein n=1 Tax=Arctia plantaginis TaxID=874455 RepID=A0A8S0YLK9_ARCPL|nr:unnamed protein product [Arctia plantaginis]
MSDEKEVTAVNAEDELSRVQRTFNKLAPLCSLEKIAKGTPQLAPQEKQMEILKNEMEETILCLSLTKQRRNVVQTAKAKRNICKSVIDYENLLEKLREEKAQKTEMDILNYLANKTILDLAKEIPSENDEIAMFERASNSLRRMENRLDLATKRLCSINTDNKLLREEINRLLVERRMFNTQWQRAIDRLVRGKGYLLDIFEVASTAFAERDEYCRKLDVLKWKGLFQLNKDIADMQFYEGDLNHLAKLEEFIRVKCSRRICEADEIEAMMMEEEIARCEKEVAKYDDLLEEIFNFTGKDSVATVIKPFRETEIRNDSLFKLLCDVMKESIFIRKELQNIRQRIMDTQEEKEATKEKQIRNIADLRMQLEEQQKRKQHQRELNLAAQEALEKVVNAIDELFRISKCNATPFLKLLGKKNANTWNVHKYVSVLEMEVKSLVQIAYGVVKPPSETPKGHKGARTKPMKLVADPHVEIIRPNKIEKLVPYLPCAYCVEEYIMNQVFETPAVPADKQYIQEILHLDEPNTKFGIHTLTIPDRRHPNRKVKTSKPN